MAADPVYLDHNATTPIARQVAEAMWPHLTEDFGNPSSASVQGRRARAALDRAREQVAALVCAHPDEIVFTSGGTEANNIAIRGAARHLATRVAVTSCVEHPATAAPLAHLREHYGWRVHELPVDGECRVRLEELPTGAIGLGTLILAHNETGALQPVADLAERVHVSGGLVHADAAQAVGKVPVDVADLGVDLLSIAGHKLYGPKGVGALFVRRGTRVAPVVVGAGQEGGLRPGTENVALIVGLGVAADLAAGLLVAEADRQIALRETLWHSLARAVPGLVRVSPEQGCLPNTLMVALPGRVGAEALETVPEIAASTGSACHAGVHSPGAALLAMGLDADTALGALRLSLGRSTSSADVDRAVPALVSALTGRPA